MIPPQTDAVIFDLDGVLWQTSTLHARAYAAVFANHGLPPVAYEQIAGRRTDEVFAEILANLRSDGAVSVQRLVEEKRAAAQALFELEPPDVAAAIAAVHALPDRLALGIASSASRASVDRFLDVSGLGGRFGCALCGDDVAKAKPAPDLYEAAMVALGAKAPVVVEDAIAGVLAARAAGASVIGMLGMYTKEELVAAGAMAVIRDLEELR